jgi:transcription elongation factor GreB
MSKAFTRESDAEDEDDEELSPVPSGKNYITPAGFHALKCEYDELFAQERPKIVETISWAAGNGDRSENGDYLYGKKRLREIDKRMRWLSKRMKSAVVVDPLAQPSKDQIFFGATVTYADEDDSARTITIVGQDEMDASAGKVSWISPVARALMKARVGDVVAVQTPGGLQNLEVMQILYGSKNSL